MASPGKQKLILSLITENYYSSLWGNCAKNFDKITVFSWYKQKGGRWRVENLIPRFRLSASPDAWHLVQSGAFKQQKYFFFRSIFKRWGWSHFGRAGLAAGKDVTSIRGRVTVPTPASSWWLTFSWSFLKTPGLFPQGSWIGGRYPSAKAWCASGGDNEAFGKGKVWLSPLIYSHFQFELKEDLCVSANKPENPSE